MDIFNLPPGHSERDIKRAYAKALKKIDIDENPNEFQQLHNAYQHALLDFEEQQREAESQPLEDTQTGCADADSMEASLQLDAHLHEANHHNNETVESFEQAQESLWQMPEGEDDNEQEQTIESHWEPEESNEISPEETPLSEEQEATARHYQQQLELLDQKLQQLLAMPKECKQLYPWLFLNEFPELNDYNFWIEASRLVYHRIADSQSPEYTGKRPDITREVLAFLDSIFNWFEYLQDPEEPAYNHHQTLYNRVQDLHGITPVATSVPPSPNSEYNSGKFAHAFVAFILDAFIFLSTFSILEALFKGTSLEHLFTIKTMPLTAIVYYLGTVSSPMQGTLGQVITNLKVTASTGDHPSIIDAMRRGAGLCILLVTAAAHVWLQFEITGIKTFLMMILAPFCWALIAWDKFDNTEIIERTSPKNKTEDCEGSLVNISISTIIDAFVAFPIIAVIVLGALKQVAGLVIEPIYTPAMLLIYYIFMLTSPLQATLGQRILRLKVINKHGQKPSTLDATKRASGLISLWGLIYLAHLLPDSENTYNWQLVVLFPTISFFVWKYLNNCILVNRTDKSKPD